MSGQEKKLIAFYISRSHEKGSYPERRASVLAADLQNDANVVFLCGPKSPPAPEGFRYITMDADGSLAQSLALLKPDLLIRDSGSTTEEDIEKYKALVPSILHFDDFGEGGKQADFVFQTLYSEAYEDVPEHFVVGHSTYIADETVSSFRKAGLRQKPIEPVPHLLIAMGDEDEENLTHRTLRHMLQLQIPLKITVIVGERYMHDVSTLRIMALSRRNTAVVSDASQLAQYCAEADVVLCSAGYTPYEVAVIGVPCVVLAQNEFELGLAFPKEEHGFIHLGLGRKVKQSALLNAVMEPLLHEPLRRKAIDKQLALELGDGKEAVCEAVRYYLEYPKRPKSAASGKTAPHMLH